MLQVFIFRNVELGQRDTVCKKLGCQTMFSDFAARKAIFDGISIASVMYAVL